jgi:sugar O-acyltransferase (sialic acid O-acetyltransferase NeuD family)
MLHIMKESNLSKQFYILGQGNYAVSMLLDNLYACFPEQSISVEIIANILADENDSLAYPYATPGIHCIEKDLSEWKPEPNIPCLVGSVGKSRRAIVEFFESQYGITADRYFPSTHPTSYCAPTLQHGQGLYIGPLSVVGPQTHFGNFVVINRKVSIGHHTILEDFVGINPGADIAGICHLGKGVIIGAGATVLDKVKIGEGSMIGAGSVVTKDIPAGVVAYGIPAKVIRSI